MEVTWNGPIQSDSFIVVCKNAYLLGLHPFTEKSFNHICYRRLNFIVDNYLIQNKLIEFTGCLLEGQYNINFLAAYFILEKFKPKLQEKLVGLNDEKSIVEDCIDTCEKYATVFDGETAIKIYSRWMADVKDYYNLK